MDITLSILGLSRWNINWNVKNSYSYQTTKIRFNLQFLRSPDAAFGDLIWWWFNWKCKFSRRWMSHITNFLKYYYFWDGESIDNVTLRLWKFSDFCSRHTVGVKGDDIMFHILVSTFLHLPVMFLSTESFWTTNCTIDHGPPPYQIHILNWGNQRECFRLDWICLTTTHVLQDILAVLHKLMCLRVVFIL